MVGVGKDYAEGCQKHDGRAQKALRHRSGEMRRRKRGTTDDTKTEMNAKFGMSESMLVRSRLRYFPRFVHLRTFIHRPAMNWSAFVLTSISSDTDPTIILNFDTAKYIFNVGENTNRAFLQSRYNWKRTKALFLTQLGTQRAGGLPGPFPESCFVSP